jgi:hypothetical protein
MNRVAIKRFSPRLTVYVFLALTLSTSQARITKIVVDETLPMPAAAGAPAYEQLAGRAFGELDASLLQNTIIQDIALAKDADGKVRYTASFVIYKPVDMKQASGRQVTLCWLARGRAITAGKLRCDPPPAWQAFSF